MLMTISQRRIAALDRLVAGAAGPFARVIARLVTIPGIGQRTAGVIVAETGGDMSRFAHLAAWAGLAPGDNESAGKRKKDHPQRRPVPALSNGRISMDRPPAPPPVPAPGSAPWHAGSAGATRRRPRSPSPTP
jgi:hypothetical protein